ncbi:phage tail protein [Leptothoe spongobia]|uniref:Phage tail protein n=1 Tax=Leptothoe spongobia TAU-MAC 1115 TaxID=1967444 RepID=A0A947DBC6_9CYAN|nr:tail fiber protein [Leptothoe spongobia]MBT9314086.1 phage tail protein [Leptothoe spongobia TAU-MAC 1115]
MADPFIGEIRIFAGNFAPRNWAFCDGSTLSISQNQALFAVLGTTYGGDGRTTLGLPDLQGRAPMHAGSGTGLTRRTLGEKGGAETQTFTEAQMPSHTHAEVAVPQNRRTSSGTAIPTNHALGLVDDSQDIYGDPSNLVAMASTSITSAGSGSESRSNMQPFLAINYIIALEGTFPSRG